MKKYILSIALLIATLPVSAALTLSDLPNNHIYSINISGKPQNGVFERVTISLPQYNRAVLFAAPIARGIDAGNQLQPWYTTDITDIFTKDHNLRSLSAMDLPSQYVQFTLLELEDGGYTAIQPISALDVTSWIEVKDKSTIDVVCGHFGQASVQSSNTPLFAYASGDDLYQVLNEMWGDILSNKQVAGRTTWRAEKEYPEVFKYLGWCSWEQYRKKIDEPLLLEAIDNIEKSKLPIRWVLVDDGHQTRSESDGALLNFEISESKFPSGWDPIISKHSDKIKWMGLWHAMYGVWEGISAEHTMENLRDHLIPRNENTLIVAEDQESSDLFYTELVGSVADPGFDFIKVDVQTRSFWNYYGKENPVIAHRQNAESLESLTDSELGGMINCMSQNLPCIFNTRNSAVTRVSVDYKVNNKDRAISHIYQSYQNTLWMGQTIWPDHDMFHSSDRDFGRLMAVSKAMSGAPIYLSDAPEDMVDELITPLVYRDGELVRPLAPGTPLPDSFFANALLGSDLYRVIAPTSSTSAAVVAYNISSNYPDGVECVVSEEDYRYADALTQPYRGIRDIPKEGLAYYDWYNRCGGKLDGGYAFRLDNSSDRLILLSQIEHGWAVIGLEGKYLSTATVAQTDARKGSIKIAMKEEGDVIIYSDSAITRATSGRVEPIGSGMYRVVGCECEVTLYK